VTAAVLDELIERYGSGAVVTVSPYMPNNSGDILRWVLRIDGEEVSDVDVRTVVHSEREDVHVMLLVYGDEEFELARWHEDAEHPHSIKAGAQYRSVGPGVTDTLGGLLRRGQAR
jgi:hypothetical protein